MIPKQRLDGLSAAVSVVVPVLHSPVIGQTLASLRGQDYPGLCEVLVVGQDGYGQVREDELVHFLPTPQPATPAVARNIGIRHARGEILAFIDADCVAASDWLSRLLDVYTMPDVAAVGGSVRFPAANYWTLCDNLATFHDYLPASRAGRRMLLPSLNLSVRRAALADVGLFDERYPRAAGEDADLAMRLHLRGHQLWFEPRAVITHYPQRQSPGAIFRHAYNFGRYSVKVDPRYRDQLYTPVPLRNSWTALLCAPVLAAGVIGRALANRQVSPAHWHTIPVFYLAKIAWCAGAARTLAAKGAFQERPA